jgi:hypothetical protein
MRYGRLAVMPLLAALWVGPASRPSTACRPADHDAADLIAYLERLVISTDSLSIKLRTRVGLPSVDSSQIVLMTNDANPTVCEQARQAYVTSFSTDTIEVSAVYVVRIGTARYVVTDLEARVGEFAALEVLDSTYAYVGGISY